MTTSETTDANSVAAKGNCNSPHVEVSGIAVVASRFAWVQRTTGPYVAGQQPTYAILDIGGNSRLSHLRRALTSDGRLVIVGGESDGRWLGGFDRQRRAMKLSPMVSQKLRILGANENSVDLSDLSPVLGSKCPNRPSGGGPRRSTSCLLEFTPSPPDWGHGHAAARLVPWPGVPQGSDAPVSARPASA